MTTVSNLVTKSNLQIFPADCSCSMIYTLLIRHPTPSGGNLKSSFTTLSPSGKDHYSFSSNGKNTLLDVSNQPNSPEHVAAADNQMQEAQLFQQLQQLSVMTAVDEKQAQP
jgi:hypothetical protein